MNTMLASGGYPWTVVPVDKRETYMQALESASVDQDILPFAQFIADCTEIYMAFYRDNEGFYGCYVHDPLAVGVAIDRALVKTEPVYMVVETEGRFTTGMSLADRRDRRDEESYPPNVEVCLDVDTERFRRMFDELLWHPYARV